MKEIKDTVEKSDVFKEYKEENPDSYIVHYFSMQKNNSRDEQMGYFSPNTRLVTTFSKEPAIVGSDEPASKEDTVQKLDFSQVSVSLDDALSTAHDVMKEHYSSQNVTQEICVLQKLGTQLWNLTLVTSAFNIINIRIDAHSGEIIKHEQHSIMSLGKPVQ